MKKSDIVMEVLSIRSGTPPGDKNVLRNLSSALKHRSLALEEWDQYLDPEFARGIIKHVSAVKGELSLYDLISDIEIILKRIS